MKRLLFAAFIGLVLAACGQAVGAAGPYSTSSAVAPTVVHVATNAKLGQILTTAAGKTLYYFTPEQGGTIACTGPCATMWPPLLATSGGIGRSETLPGTLATIKRAEGTQVTYSEWPLYTFSGDTAPGDTNGEGLFGKWFVATPNLTDAPVAASTAPTPAPTAAPVATQPPMYQPPAKPTSCIPGANGGDHDGDNNGAASDGDGCL